MAKRLGRGILLSCVALTIAPTATLETVQANYLYGGAGNLARGVTLFFFLLTNIVPIGTISACL